MPYTELQSLSASEFKRLRGVTRETFIEMSEVLRPHLERQGRRGGQTKLNVEDQLLVTLEYWATSAKRDKRGQTIILQKS